MNKKILICSGGTGGHVMPAINFGNYMIKKGYECFLILDKRGKKYSKEFNGKIFVINSSHLTGNIFFKFKSLLLLLIGFIESLIIVFKIKPEKCISFGSYATFMPLLSILILRLFFKINIYIHEQNSIIGKVNLFFLPYSKYLFTNFNYIKNLEKKNNKKKYYVGLPTKIVSNSYDFKTFNFNEKKIIFIYGGSQGSIRLINNFLLLLKNLDQKYLKKIKLIIQSPKKTFNNLILFLKQLKIDFEIRDFYNNIDEILSITNIAITRAGSGTINDLIKHKIPAIIIPLPHSIYNHQYYNAKYLSNKNAAILMDEKDFNIDINTNILEKLIDNNEQLKIIKNALDTIILPDANKIMLSKIYK